MAMQLVFPFRIDLSRHTGKVVGAALGLFYGFWGVVVGFAAGYASDEWKIFLQSLNNRAYTPNTVPPDAAVVLGVVRLARALALAGLKQHMAALAALKKHFSLDDTTLRYIGKILHGEEVTREGPALIASQLRLIFGGLPHKMKAALQALLELAQDEQGVIDGVSFHALEDVARHMGFKDEEFAALASLYETDAGEDPYAVLQVAPSADFDAVREAYKKRILETHPDRFMQHENPFAVQRAQEKAARINAAYARIRKVRA